MSFSKSSIIDIATHCAERDKHLVICSIQYVANQHGITPLQISERLKAKGKDRSDLVEILNAACEIAINKHLESHGLYIEDLSVCTDDSGSLEISIFVPSEMLDNTDTLLRETAFMYPDANIQIIGWYEEETDIFS